jgi:hypothetical protein
MADGIAGAPDTICRFEHSLRFDGLGSVRAQQEFFGNNQGEFTSPVAGKFPDELALEKQMNRRVC